MKGNKSSKKSSEKKPDKLVHEGSNFETAKKAKLPGQMGVPEELGNQTKFVGQNY